MKISRLNKYREIRGNIAENRRYLKAASQFLYEDPKFPPIVAELTEKTSAIEKYCDQHYSDVAEFVAAAAMQDPSTGYVMKAYYHDSMTWEELAKAGRMDPKHAEELARAYLAAHCEKDPEPKPAAPAPGHRAAGRPAMCFPGMGIMSKHHSAVKL